MPTYTVKQGDCISSIADQMGFFWDTVWNDPNNEQLRNRRKNPNAHLHLGALYQQRGMWTEAEHEYRLLFDANPRSEIARKLWENARQHLNH